MPTEKLYFNGINGATGDYGLPPMTGAELAAFIRGEREPKNLNELRARHRAKTEGTLGVVAGVDPNKLDQAGWGILFAYDADPAVKEALTDLIALRKNQAGDRFRLYEGAEGYRRGKDTKTSFLARHGVGPGPAVPDKVPYYVLIVGSPDAIPYDFQYELDVQYAVGRIHFDNLQEYANYAASVVAAENKKVKLPRRAAFFGVANPGDLATELSSKELIEELGNVMSSKGLGWQVEPILGEKAVKVRLKDLLGGPQTPALLMTGSHGMEFPLNDPRQLPHQGALLCQDWPGVAAWGGKPISQDFYFSGDDLTGGESLLGMLAFFFACYGAGTPKLDDFSRQAFKDRMPIAPFPFLANLPKKMLGHPRGGALAVIGHIERAWTFSFRWPDVGAQTTVFECTLQQLMEGHTVGSALEYFNERWAEEATVLCKRLEDISFGAQFDPYELADLWTANNDARSYVIIGDPAVRLAVADTADAKTERPTIEPITVKAATTFTTSALPQTEEAKGVAPVEFGVMDTFKQAQGRLTGALQEFADKLGQSLKKAFEDVSTLQVSTYVSENMTGVTYDSAAGQFKGPVKLRALTHIKIDGDTVVCVPESGAEIDKTLWSIHSDMVQKAQTHRTELLKAVVSAAAELVKLV